MTRVVVTGLGLSTALGAGAPATARALRAGGRALRRPANWSLPRSELPPLAVAPAAEGGPAETPRCLRLALPAAHEALAVADLRAPPARRALALGSTTGGMPESERAYAARLRGEAVDPAVWSRHELAATADAVARSCG
ncbi:MAG: hypothetical protein D6731_17515, partial [Planctomycetota bacterium]